MTRITANLLLILIAMVWGSAFVAQNHGMSHIGPMLFTGLRFLLGTLVVTPLVLLEGRRRGPQRRRLQRQDVLQVCGLGLLLGAGAALQQIGIASTSVTNAGFLTAIYVPMVPLLGWALLRHVPHWSVVPGVLACLIGAYLLSGAQGLEMRAGDLWVIASAIPWAFHVLLVGRVAERLDAPFFVAWGQFLVCGLVALGWAAVTEPLEWQSVVEASVPLAYTGIVSVGFAFTAQVVAQRYAHATDAAIVLSSETLFAALSGYWWMGDRIGTRGVAGCALIFISMLAVQLLAFKRPEPATETPAPGRA